MINRKTLGTFILAGVVMLGTTAASGGCGGSSPGVSAPQVGQGGVENEPSGEPPASSTPDEPSEPPNEGKDPCNAHLSEITLGGKMKTTLTVGPCAGSPEQYGGSLMLQYGTGTFPNLKWSTATLIPIYSEETTQDITATCQDAYWVAVYESAGRDSKGKEFAQTYSRFYEENGIPREANCP